MSPVLDRLRPAPVLAIARRDWALQLGRGRRAWALPVIAAVLLVPLAAIPWEAPSDPTVRRLVVTGDVPEAVLASPHVVRARGPRADLVFETDPDGQPVVVARWLSDAVRATLDEATPGTHPDVVDVRVERKVPSRSLLVALITGSILTGAVAEALPGERSRRTLETLLAAAVTRLEIVLGKWLAWGGFGVVACFAATAISVAFGRQELGPWALAAPLVPLGTVASGLYLVRRSTDVVGGATIAIRVLPAALAGLGILSWALGELVSPWAGAAIPIGGALIASGDIWPVAPTLLGAATTAALTAAALVATARDLEVDGATSSSAGRTFIAASAAVGAVAWWVATMTPALWTAAGNPHVGEDMGPERSALAGVFTFGTLALVALGRPDAAPVPWVRSAPRAVLAALGGGALLAVSPSGADVWTSPTLGEIAHRMASATNAAAMSPWQALPLLLVTELWFRGVVRERAGRVLSVAVWVLSTAPLDPLGGLCTGAVLLAAAETGGLTAAIGARLVAAALLTLAA